MSASNGRRDGNEPTTSAEDRAVEKKKKSRKRSVSVSDDRQRLLSNGEGDDRPSNKTKKNVKSDHTRRYPHGAVHPVFLYFYDPELEQRYFDFCYIESNFNGGKIWFIIGTLISLVFFVYFHGIRQGWSTDMITGPAWVALFANTILAILLFFVILVERFAQYREVVYLIALAIHWPAFTITAFFGMKHINPSYDQEKVNWPMKFAFVHGCLFFCTFVAQGRFFRAVPILLLSPLVTLILTTTLWKDSTDDHHAHNYWNERGRSHAEISLWLGVFFPPILLQVFERLGRKAFTRMDICQMETELVSLRMVKTHDLICRFFAKTPTLDFLSHTNIDPRPRLYKEAILIYSDLAQFTRWSSQFSAQHVTRRIGEMFFAIDMVAPQFSVEKIMTVGDAYIGAIFKPLRRSGDFTHGEHGDGNDDGDKENIDVKNASARGEDDHGTEYSLAYRCANACLFATNILGTGSPLNMRVGVASGNVVVAFVGTKPPRFDVFGKTADEAQLLEQTAIEGTAHISAVFAAQIGDQGRPADPHVMEDTHSVCFKYFHSSGDQMWQIASNSYTEDLSVSQEAHNTSVSNRHDESALTGVLPPAAAPAAAALAPTNDEEKNVQTKPDEEGLLNDLSPEPSSASLAQEDSLPVLGEKERKRGARNKNRHPKLVTKFSDVQIRNISTALASFCAPQRAELVRRLSAGIVIPSSQRNDQNGEQESDLDAGGDDTAGSNDQQDHHHQRDLHSNTPSQRSTMASRIPSFGGGADLSPSMQPLERQAAVSISPTPNNSRGTSSNVNIQPELVTKDMTFNGVAGTRLAGATGGGSESKNSSSGNRSKSSTPSTSSFFHAPTASSVAGVGVNPFRNLTLEDFANLPEEASIGSAGSHRSLKTLVLLNSGGGENDDEQAGNSSFGAGSGGGDVLSGGKRSSLSEAKDVSDMDQDSTASGAQWLTPRNANAANISPLDPSALGGGSGGGGSNDVNVVGVDGGGQTVSIRRKQRRSVTLPNDPSSAQEKSLCAESSGNTWLSPTFKHTTILVVDDEGNDVREETEVELQQLDHSGNSHLSAQQQQRRVSIISPAINAIVEDSNKIDELSKMNPYWLRFENPKVEALYASYLATTNAITSAYSIITAFNAWVVICQILLLCLQGEVRNVAITSAQMGLMLICLFGLQSRRSLSLLGHGGSGGVLKFIVQGAFVIVALLAFFLKVPHEKDVVLLLHNDTHIANTSTADAAASAAYSTNPDCDPKTSSMYTGSIINAYFMCTVLIAVFSLQNSLIVRLLNNLLLCCTAAAASSIRSYVFDDFSSPLDMAYLLGFFGLGFASYFADYTLRCSFAADRQLRLILRQTKTAENEALHAALEIMLPPFVLEKLLMKKRTSQKDNGGRPSKKTKLLLGLDSDELQGQHQQHTWEYERAGVMFIKFQYEDNTDDETNDTTTSSPSGGGLSPASIEEMNDVLLEMEEIIKHFGLHKIKSIGPSLLCAAGLNAVASSSHTQTNKRGSRSGSVSNNAARRRSSSEKSPLKRRSLDSSSIGGSTSGDGGGGEVSATATTTHAIPGFTPQKLGVMMMKAADAIRSMIQYRPHLKLQIGVHIGPCIGAVLGKRSLMFDLFGDTVNVASRLCTLATKLPPAEKKKNDLEHEQEEQRAAATLPSSSSAVIYCSEAVLGGCKGVSQFKNRLCYHSKQLVKGKGELDIYQFDREEEGMMLKASGRRVH